VSRAAVGHVDGDGDLDLVVANQWGRLPGLINQAPRRAAAVAAAQLGDGGLRVEPGRRRWVALRSAPG